MLIVLPSDGMTTKASVWLNDEGVAHQVIGLPTRLEYKTGANTAIFLDGDDNMDVPMRLSKQRFVVMRVFREFELQPGDVANDA